MSFLRTQNHAIFTVKKPMCKIRRPIPYLNNNDRTHALATVTRTLSYLLSQIQCPSYSDKSNVTVAVKNPRLIYSDKPHVLATVVNPMS